MTPSTGLYLHAVAVSGPRGAILLLGRSSSGKTTLSSLVCERFPVLADDWLFAFPDRNGAWMVMDGKRFDMTPEPGKLYKFDDFCQHGIAYPVHSFIRIFAAKNTEIQSISQMKTCEYLMHAVFEIPMQSLNSSVYSKKQWFHAAAEMARKYKGWRLRFSLDAVHAVDAIRQAS